MHTTSIETELGIQRFLALEAKLLDENRLNEWFELLADDVRYFMPVRETLPLGPDRPSSPAKFALFDDDKNSIRLRVLRALSNVAPTESPPPVTQRLITNVLTEPTASADEYRVYSNFIVHNERRGRHVSMFVGSREDLLRRTDRGWRIAGRQVNLAQAILPMTISIFF
jgi:3-phenylpropionate/cinnamic acid dioxygenase small subunit